MQQVPGELERLRRGIHEGRVSWSPQGRAEEAMEREGLEPGRGAGGVDEA